MPTFRLASFPALTLAYALGLALPVSAAEPTTSANPTTEPTPRLMQTDEALLRQIFAPPSNQTAALSPDGQHIAYSVRTGSQITIVVVAVDRPSVARARVIVASDRLATGMLETGRREAQPAQIRWLGWTSPTRVVVETNQTFSEPTDSGWRNSQSGVIFGFNVDGSDARELLSPKDVSSPRRPTSANPRPVDSYWQELDDPFTEAVDSPTDEAETPLPANLPRSPRILDYAPGGPNALLVRTSDIHDYTVYRLDTLSGALKPLAAEAIDANHTPLLSRQGRILARVPASRKGGWPLRYDYEERSGLHRWRAFDDRPASTKDLIFRNAPNLYFSSRSVPLGFDENPDIVYYASNVGRDTFGIYSVNLKTGSHNGLSVENADCDLVTPASAGIGDGGALLFDRYSRRLAGIRFEAAQAAVRWLLPELQLAQQAIERALPGRSVRLRGWDEAKRRFLVDTEGPTDPGAFYVYDQPTQKLMEFARKAPWRDATVSGRTAAFRFTDARQRVLTASLTLPGADRPAPVAVVALFSREPWARIRSGFDPEVMALAQLGLAVLQVNVRGTVGFGRSLRDAVAPDYEESQIADVLSALDHVLPHLPMKTKRVVAMGTQWGGFVALRAVQLHPERFRCAIAFSPLIEPGEWLASQAWGDDDPTPELTAAAYGTRARFDRAPLQKDVARIRGPVLVMSYPGPDGETRKPAQQAIMAFTRKLRQAGGTVETEDLSVDFNSGLPNARAAAYKRIEAFLNTHLFSFGVELGPLETVHQPGSAP